MYLLKPFKNFFGALNSKAKARAVLRIKRGRFACCFQGQNFFFYFNGPPPPPPPGGQNPFLDPLLWPQACFDPHVVKPVFSIDSENVCFQELNQPSSGSKMGFVTFAWARTPPGRGKTIFWTPCCGHRPVLTPMLLSQFFL